MICPEMIGSSSPYPYFKSGRVNMLDFGAKRCAAVERRAVESRGDNIGTASVYLKDTYHLAGQIL